MWLKIQIGIFLIFGTAAITLFFWGLAILMERVYGNSPKQREQRSQAAKSS
ncbi:MAG: hypothetical protein HZA19_02475 [Nitrospirae bacterium]|nr:hypothetical protein [Nitrospirota bacterium]